MTESRLQTERERRKTYRISSNHHYNKTIEISYHYYGPEDCNSAESVARGQVLATGRELLVVHYIVVSFRIHNTTSLCSYTTQTKRAHVVDFMNFELWHYIARAASACIAPSLQSCCWNIMLLSLHPNVIVHVENVVSLFSSPSTSSQKVRKCGSHNFLSQST